MSSHPPLVFIGGHPPPTLRDSNPCLLSSMTYLERDLKYSFQYFLLFICLKSLEYSKSLPNASYLSFELIIPPLLILNKFFPCEYAIKALMPSWTTYVI